MESGNSKATRQVRLYVEDAELLSRKARAEQVTRNRYVSIGEIVHEQLAELRLAERAAGRERGT
jgi:hypothetical protein